MRVILASQRCCPCQLSARPALPMVTALLVVHVPPALLTPLRMAL